MSEWEEGLSLVTFIGKPTYHYAEPESKKTLCGLAIWMYRGEVWPPGRTFARRELCKRCERSAAAAARVPDEAAEQTPPDP